MQQSVVRYNTYLQAKETRYIDTISKGFIICEFILGLNRLPIFGHLRFIYVLFTFAYSVLFEIFIVSMFIFVNANVPFKIILLLTVVELTVNAIYSYATWKKMRLFYDELNKFDMEVGCRPRIPKNSIKNIVFSAAMVVMIYLFYIIINHFHKRPLLSTGKVPMDGIFVLEMCYFGHLLNLLTPRLRLINYYMELSLSNNKDKTEINIKEFVFFKRDVKNSNCEMKKLMNLYHTIIKAYDYLIEAIKWQLLLMIVTAFILDLILCYNCLYNIFHKEYSTYKSVHDIALSLVLILPVFSPCIFADRIHNEVRRLKELVASRLYENDLDKSGRRIARALLAFTETRDLSFSLLRMVNINISLPFKYIGLLVTYVIILLQFEKVINP